MIHDPLGVAHKGSLYISTPEDLHGNGKILIFLNNR